MLDARLRPLIDPPLAIMARRLAAFGVKAGLLTLMGLAAGLAAAVAIAAGAPGVGLALFLLGRLVDGLDGTVARLSAPSDRGGFIDIVADFAIYAAMPLAFAVADPAANALAAATLLASFILSGITFLAFAVFAAKRDITTTAQGQKSIFYLAGLAEGFETIAAFAAMCLWPAAFAPIAFAFAALCFVSAAGRVVLAVQLLG